MFGDHWPKDLANIDSEAMKTELKHERSPFKVEKRRKKNVTSDDLQMVSSIS